MVLDQCLNSACKSVRTIILQILCDVTHFCQHFTATRKQKHATVWRIFFSGHFSLLTKSFAPITSSSPHRPLMCGGSSPDPIIISVSKYLSPVPPPSFFSPHRYSRIIFKTVSTVRS